MKLSRQKFWLLLQGGVITLLLCYQALWLMAIPTTGTVISIDSYKSVKSAQIEYLIDYTPHYTWATMDGDFSRYHLGQQLQISYLPFAKGSARVNGITADMMICVVWYAIFLVITVAIFIMPNYLLEKKCSFIISKRPPFIKYVVEERRQKKDTVSLIERANLIAGYIERFMFPFAMSGFAALILYLFTWSVYVVIASFATGTVFGVFRARKWRKNLSPNNPELDALDNQPTWTDEISSRKF